MREVYKIDNNGFYLETVHIVDTEDTPSDCVEVQPQGFYKAKWVSGNWVEIITEEELDEMRKKPRPQSVSDRVDGLEILYLMDMGVL